VTSIDKSDSQLDAEAATPLSELIRKHRIYYRRDLDKPELTSDDPPVFDGETQATAIGVPLSWPLTSHAFSETRFVEENGERIEEPVRSIHTADSLWAKALFRQWGTCRRSHPEHAERKSFRGSLCKLVVGLVIRQEWSVKRVADELQLDEDRVAEVLRSALKGIDRAMTQVLEKADFRFREDLGRFSWDEALPVHHAVPGLHMDCCPQCRDAA
jgi:hypothetical protein